MKICTKCEMELPATTEYFHKNKYGKYGLAARCKLCMNEYRSIEYRKRYGKRGNFDKKVTITDFGVGDRELDIKLIKGKKYLVPNIKRSKNISDNFTGKLEMETKDLIVLRHKRGFCECFLKVDFLTKELKLVEV